MNEPSADDVRIEEGPVPTGCGRRPPAPFVPGPLGPDQLQDIDAYWRAANYLSVGQIYLMDNPLLRQPLDVAHLKPRLLGHWGTTPGLNFIYAHLNRVIRARDLDMIGVWGPGHGAPGLVANAYLEGTYSEVYPDVARDTDGLCRLMRQFSFPGGIPSHASPELPGSIHEGGELGYALAHAFGAALDNPGLIVACTVGDGEAETGPLAAAWHSAKFLDPATDGAVLPILHLNGYKIANPTILDRMPETELRSLLAGYGYEPAFVGGSDPAHMHQAMAAALDGALDDIAKIQASARGGETERPRWPMIVLRSPKGWTGPKTVDGKPVEDTWRSHQVPVAAVRENPEHRAILERWLRSYRPEELFDGQGRLIGRLAALAPEGERRLSANPQANGGRHPQPLRLPDLRRYAVTVPGHGAAAAEATRVLGTFLRDVIALNAEARNFRLMGPDETTSNRLDAVFAVTDRVWQEAILPSDDHLARQGRVMEVLSEHLCEGWLEGYVLTGRHGVFACYEAFIHIVDSMVNQHAKWLKGVRALSWRRPVPSLNILLSSHVWRQDHNGFSHQDPGFIDFVANKRGDIQRIYLPPDANTLLCIMDHCLRTHDRINVVVAGKQPAPQWLGLDEAARHCAAGAGIWDWASNEGEAEPDVVMACAGDVPTLETLAAVDWLRRHVPDLRVRVVNVVDLMTLASRAMHPHGLDDPTFDGLFTRHRPVVFAYHGYPWLIHRLTYKRANHENLHVHGFIDEGTTTTPFDMCVLNRLDRFHLALAALQATPRLGGRGDHAQLILREVLDTHREYVRRTGDDLPEVKAWVWSGGQAPDPRGTGADIGPRGPSEPVRPGETVDGWTIVS
ncbi:Xylulose-5-phosphate phosphoketolase [Methylobacterium adhaesivum]|uniref:Probable phosphoketolase n=1 Tax=Methylobacterium adhaesivum TaxID=333297 RepID=A0ABT8BLB0_9HYPH|nr:phosphoketolase family protein [Methylobacterium adhaesivum]MDN3592984.1 phosphoketolase family protein [Methylobacterium adhaesivum]GJD32233.1 Xylulose-5-phosphate phosphoketolase [Methylobacterium adhaesivum]